MSLKKVMLLSFILGIPFLTGGCALQDKIAELNMNEMEKLIANANSKEDFHEDTNACPNDCVEGCDNEHYVTWQNYYQGKGINSTLYKFSDNNYNAIVAFKDESTVSDAYAVRVLTDVEIGNAGGTYFAYELGRILINKNNPKKSKKPFKLQNVCDGRGTLAVINISDDWNENVCGEISPSDIEGLSGESFAVYEHFSKELKIIDLLFSIFLASLDIVLI